MAAQGDLGRTLTPERWRQIERLFDGALEQPAEDRSAWLTATVDPDLRDDILSLLAAHEEAEGLLDRPCPAPLHAPESPLAPGQRLGPYEIVAPLASGGMGYVFRAHDARLGRDVALKLLAPRLASHPQSLRRFEREARAVAALSHPNIVALHDVGREGAHAFVVLELLQGETLRSRLARGPLLVPEALRLARDVARGLGAAHARGLVHRDLKPDNVWLCASGPAKVLDFGIARFATSPRHPSRSRRGARTAAGAADLEPAPGTAGGILGTAGYLSPSRRAASLPTPARTSSRSAASSTSASRAAAPSTRGTSQRPSSRCSETPPPGPPGSRRGSQGPGRDRRAVPAEGPGATVRVGCRSGGGDRAPGGGGRVAAHRRAGGDGRRSWPRRRSA